MLVPFSKFIFLTFKCQPCWLRRHPILERKARNLKEGFICYKLNYNNSK